MLPQQFSFSLTAQKGTARAGEFTTSRGVVKTPIFMPVGTLATVKALDTKDIYDTGADIILANTYHLYLRPGMEKLQALGGVHQFMGWDKPLLTDSGGFQVFSLGRQQSQKTGAQTKGIPQAKITDEGVGFTSHLDGSKHFFSPEKAIDIQRQIGSDIIMAFDECVGDTETHEYVAASLEKTHAWAKRCVEHWESYNRMSVYGNYQALFGIIQGALYPDLRKKSAEYITALPFDGIAVGGETIGYNMAGTAEVMEWIQSSLPHDKPRYAMGLGRDPQNLIDAVLAGFDMFDCVGPTRLARNGALYVGELEEKNGTITMAGPNPKNRLQIGNAASALDTQVIQPGCPCYTCTSGYTRAYLHHLWKSDELTYHRLASIHNVTFMVDLSKKIREWVIR